MRTALSNDTCPLTACRIYAAAVVASPACRTKPAGASGFAGPRTLHHVWPLAQPTLSLHVCAGGVWRPTSVELNTSSRFADEVPEGQFGTRTGQGPSRARVSHVKKFSGVSIAGRPGAHTIDRQFEPVARGFTAKEDLRHAYMLVFNETPSKSAERDDASKAGAYWGGLECLHRALKEAGIMISGNGLQPPRLERRFACGTACGMCRMDRIPTPRNGWVGTSSLRCRIWTQLLHGPREALIGGRLDRGTSRSPSDVVMTVEPNIAPPRRRESGADLLRSADRHSRRPDTRRRRCRGGAG